MFRLLDASYPLLLSHTSPDAPIFSYLLLVRLPSRNLHKTVEHIKASEKKKTKKTPGP